MKQFPIIQFDTDMTAGDWKIVSVYLTNTDLLHGEMPFPLDYMWGGVYFDREGREQSMMQLYYGLMRRSMVDTGVDLKEDDKIILLAAKSDTEGFHTVIVARKVRRDEDTAVDIAKIKESGHALYPDEWYASGEIPDYWPQEFKDALSAGLIDWYSGDLYD